MFVNAPNTPYTLPMKILQDHRRERNVGSGGHKHEKENRISLLHFFAVRLRQSPLAGLQVSTSTHPPARTVKIRWRSIWASRSYDLAIEGWEPDNRTANLEENSWLSDFSVGRDSECCVCLEEMERHAFLFDWLVAKVQGRAIAINVLSYLPPVRALSCGHAFHDECIRAWVHRRAPPRCPTCREPIRTRVATVD